MSQCRLLSLTTVSSKETDKRKEEVAEEKELYGAVDRRQI